LNFENRSLLLWKGFVLRTPSRPPPQGWELAAPGSVLRAALRSPCSWLYFFLYEKLKVALPFFEISV